MKKLIILYTAYLALGGALSAQDLNADLLNVLEVYQSSDQLTFNTKVKMFDRKNTQSIAYESGSKFLRSGEKMMLEFEGIKRIINDNGVLIINTNDKLINFFPIEKTELKITDLVPASEINIVEEMQKSIAGIEDVVFDQRENGVKHYVLTPANGDFKTIEIFIDQAPFFDKIIYHYNAAIYPSSSHVVVDYQAFNNTNSIAASAFELESYLNYKAEKITLTKAFENFELSVYEN